MAHTFQRASATTIVSITDSEGTSLHIPTCIQNWENAALTAQHYAKVILKYRGKEVEKYLRSLDYKQRKYAKPHVVGRKIQADSRNVDGVNGARTKAYKQFRVYSRLDEIIRAHVITATRGTMTRSDTYQSIINNMLYGTTLPRTSAGNKRTVRPNPTTPGKTLDFNYTDAQYCALVRTTDRELSYRLVCGKEYVNLTVVIPRHLRGAEKITQPKMVWDAETGKFSIILTATFKKPHYRVSDRYVIGLDVGIKNYVTYAVYDTKNATAVETGTLSNRLDYELYTSINKTKRQIRNLWEKIETVKQKVENSWYKCPTEKDFQEIERLYRDIQDQRLSLSRKRKRMAVESALEVKNISIKYGNAVVARENLSWVGNTMSNGRWNCGEFFTKLEEVLEKDGGTSMWVSAYYTTKSCSSCGNAHKKVLKGEDKQFHYDTKDRVIYCEACGCTLDRDVNAAINIAKRASCSAFFTSTVDNLSDKPAQSNPRVFVRGRSPQWHRERQRKKSRDKHTATTRRDDRIEEKKLEIVPVAKIPLDKIKSSKQEVKKKCFSVLYPLQFDSLPGIDCSIGVSTLVLSQEQKELFRQKVRDVLQK